MASSAPITPDLQALILEKVAVSGDLGLAARSAGVPVNRIRALERKDAAFADALAEAWREFSDTILIPEARRRAVDGVPRGVYFQGKLSVDPRSGEPVVENHYSDGVLLRLLEVFDHRFRPHSVQQVTQKNVSAADLDKLSPEARAKLEAFLEQRVADEQRRDQKSSP